MKELRPYSLNFKVSEKEREALYKAVGVAQTKVGFKIGYATILRIAANRLVKEIHQNGRLPADFFDVYYDEAE